MNHPPPRNAAQVNAQYPGIFDLFGYSTDKAIGEHYGISRKTAFAIRKKFGIPAGEPASEELIRQAEEPAAPWRAPNAKRPGQVRPTAKRKAPSDTHGGRNPKSMVRESHTSTHRGMTITVFIWLHMLLSDPKPWWIAIEHPDGREYRPCEDADKSSTMGEALARAWWHCDRMAEGVVA